MNKKIQTILLIAFFVFLITPSILKLTNLFQEEMKSENRKMAEKPEIDIYHLDKFPKKYEAYFNDHFGLRELGLEAYNNFNYFFLKKSPTPENAIMGKDGWLFQGKDINHYRGSDRLSAEELNALEAAFIERCAFLKKQNCRLLFVVVPTKKIIYPEYMPDEYFRYSEKTMTDQFIEMLQEKTCTEVLDLRPIIKAAKKDHPVLYHKMDNHWNDIAAYYSSKAIVDYLGQTMNVGKIHEFDEYTMDTTIFEGGAIAQMLGVDDKMIDYRLHMIPKFETNFKRLSPKYPSPERFAYPDSYEGRFAATDSIRPRAMIITDSFGEYFHKFLPEHFSYSLFLFDVWEYNLHPKKVLEEKPDVFIIVTFEGFIRNIFYNLYREENLIPEENISN